MDVPTVSCADILMLHDAVLMDTRSSAEYAESHIPGALSYPLLDNFERHLIGLTYVHHGQDAAIKKGFELFSPRLATFCSDILKYKDKTIVVYCARGGLRSRLVVEFFTNKEKILTLIERVGAQIDVTLFSTILDSLASLKIFQLSGGYKSYRTFLLERLASFSYKMHFCVLYGLTAVGKSAVLEELASLGLPVIHLEELAQHRSSVFGAVGLSPVSQKMFESNLFVCLERYAHEPIVFIEGESRKVGNILLPESLFVRMQEGTLILLTASLSYRVEHIIAEYFCTSDRVQQVRNALSHLTKKVGVTQVQELTCWLDAQDYTRVAEWLLVSYYDKVYACIVQKLNYAYTFPTTEAVKEITLLHKTNKLFLK